MLPARYDKIVIHAGRSWRLSLNWKDAAGALYNLSSYTGTLTFYAPNSTTIAKQLTATAGLTLGSTQWNIVAAMTAAQTAALDFGRTKKAFAVLDLQSADGLTDYPLFEGTTSLHSL